MEKMREAPSERDGASRILFPDTGQTARILNLLWREFLWKPSYCRRRVSGAACAPTICPEVFSLENGESAQAAAGPIPDGLKLAVQEAADACPAAAIEVR